MQVIEVKCNIVTGQQAVVRILSDGKTWLSTKKNNGTIRVDGNTRPKPSVDLTRLCQFDKRLIQLAIKAFFGGEA